MLIQPQFQAGGELALHGEMLPSTPLTWIRLPDQDAIFNRNYESFAAAIIQDPSYSYLNPQQHTQQHTQQHHINRRIYIFKNIQVCI